MNEQQLDELYTLICRKMSVLGEGRAELFLARLSLLLMRAVDQPERIRQAIDEAANFDDAPS